MEELKYGICFNIDECSNAKEGATITVAAEEEMVCPVCGDELEEIESGGFKLGRPILLGILGVVVAGMLGFAIFSIVSSNLKGASEVNEEVSHGESEDVTPNITPNESLETHSIFDNTEVSPSDNDEKDVNESFNDESGSTENSSKTICSSCNGLGTENYTETCKDCEKGQVDCPVCFGGSILGKCLDCHKGSTFCEKCDGNGALTVGNSTNSNGEVIAKEIDCPDCNDGYVACKSCNGGKLKCKNSCSKHNLVECKKCKGSSTITKTRNCTTCSGNKYL